jgi:Tfp pilus assembly protein PilV
MRPDPTPLPARSREAGMTLVETVVSLVVLVAVMVLVGGAAVSITGLQRQSQVRLKAQSSSRTLLSRLRDELVTSTCDKDPATDLFRYETFVDGSGKRALRFQSLVGTRMEANELVATWSSWIEYHVGTDGVVTRTQDGRSSTVATGIDAIDLTVTAAQRFQISCVTIYRDPGSGDAVRHTDTLVIAPLN